jgi:hypothetical protein
LPAASGATPTFSVAASLVQASPPAKKNVVTFGTQTATATKPDSRGIYTFASTPGGRVEDHVAIINYSAQTATFLLRGTDAVNTPQGGFAARPINEPSHDVGTWIALPSNDLSVTLPPRTTLIVPFLLEVPANATPGDHIGVITASLESSVISKSGQRVHLLQTVGSRVFLRVSGPLHPLLAVTGLAIHYNGTLDPIGTGKANVTYTVTNTGNVALGGRQSVYVSGLFGTKSSASHVPQLQLLLPGNSVKQTVQVSGIYPELHETAHVSIQPLVIAGTAEPSSGPFRASTSFWAVPWLLIAIVVALILLGFGWVRLRRRGRPTGGGTETEPDKPAADNTTPDLAVKAEAAAGPNGSGEPDMVTSETTRAPVATDEGESA